jgi:hypothetical protein
MKSTGRHCWTWLLQLDWPADDAWQKARLGNRMRDSHIRNPTTAMKLSLLPGLLAKKEMAQRSNPAPF